MLKYKNDNANILLEVLLMLAILIVVFPMLQKNVKERSDAIRNQLVVKDMMKIKTATENYLKSNPSFKEVGVFEIPFATLEKHGLPKNFKNASGNAPRTNILGQNYRVKLKRDVKGDGTVKYDAIVIADGNPDISDMRIREIVKESRGFGGYLEDGMIYGTGWALESANWGEDWTNGLPLIFKVGFEKKDYEYVRRDSVTPMLTDLYMNMNDIRNVGNLYMRNESRENGHIDVNELKVLAGGCANISLLSIDDKLTLGKDMNAKKATLLFLNGILHPSLTISSDETENLSLSDTLKVLSNLSTSNTEDTDNRFNFINVDKLALDTEVTLSVGGSIKAPDNTTTMALFKNANIDSVNIDARGMSYKPTGQSTTHANVGFVFGDLSVDSTGYNIFPSSSTVTNIRLSDVIVRKVNDLFTKDINGNTIYTRVGDIIITEKTPMSVILRALAYEYYDLYRVVEGKYPNSSSEEPNPVAGLCMPEHQRCTYQTCPGKDWSY